MATMEAEKRVRDLERALRVEMHELMGRATGLEGALVLLGDHPDLRQLEAKVVGRIEGLRFAAEKLGRLLEEQGARS